MTRGGAIASGVVRLVRALVACAVLACLVGAARGEVVARGEILAVGADGHVWWIDPKPDGIRKSLGLLSAAAATGAPEGAIALLHSSTRDVGAHVRVAASYGDMPEALAAHGARVWLVFPPAADAHRRDVLTLESALNAATGLHYSVPPTGADLLPSLPAAGDLVGFAADADGPWALFAPAPAQRFGVRRIEPTGEHDAAAADGAPRLMRLEGSKWLEVPLPDALRWEGGATLASVGDGLAGNSPGLDGAASAVALLSRAEDGSTECWRLSREGWSRTSLPVLFSGSEFFLAGGHAAVRRPLADATGVGYVRPSGVIPWFEVPWSVVGSPQPNGFVVGDSGGAWAYHLGASPPTRQRIWAYDARPQEAEPLTTPGFTAARWIHLPILCALAIAATLVVILRRSLAADMEAVPTCPILPLERRVVALLIDLLPGAVVAMLVLGATPFELLFLPAMSFDIEASRASALMIGIACAHGCIGECVWGRSLGKSIVGGRVLCVSGSPASVGATLVRNLFKALLLAAPLLALLTLLNPQLRGMGEIVSRTVVAGRE